MIRDVDKARAVIAALFSYISIRITGSTKPYAFVYAHHATILPLKCA